MVVRRSREAEALQAKLRERAVQAAKNALLVCALDFARRACDRGVLCAVAQSYTAIVRQSRDHFQSNNIDIDDGATLRTQLGRAERELCSASKALSDFGRGTVERLLRAAQT